MNRQQRILQQLEHLMEFQVIRSAQRQSNMPGYVFTIETMHHGTRAYTTPEVEAFLHGVQAGRWAKS